MLVVGLTGGIASGKSTVAAEFARLGADVVDTDVIAREVVAAGSEGLAAVTAAFGDGILDAHGALDRRALRRMIFADEHTRACLEAILHPRIEARVHALIDASPGPYVLLVIPLLVESGWHRLVDRVLVVDVDETRQTERLQARDGHTAEEAREALATQASRDDRLAHAHDVIDNRGGADTLRKEVDRLHARYLAIATERPAGD